MTPADIPQPFVDACNTAIDTAYAASPYGGLGMDDGIRIMLAAVLPLHEQQVRAEVIAAAAADLAHAFAQRDQLHALGRIAALWHDVNTRIGEASGNGNPPDPYLLASLLDGRAGLWMELARLRDADPNRPNTADVYAVACHYAAILDQTDAARVRYAYSIPTLHPGALASRLDLDGHAVRRCRHCGRPWQLDTDGACEKCPRLLWGISPQSAADIGKYPPGEPWEPRDYHHDEDGD